MNANYTASSLPVVGSKVNDYSVATLGAAQVAVTPTLEGSWGLVLRATSWAPQVRPT